MHKSKKNTECCVLLYKQSDDLEFVAGIPRFVRGFGLVLVWVSVIIVLRLRLVLVSELEQISAWRLFSGSHDG